MAESSTIRRDNPLFIRYGALVERNFSSEAEVGTPLYLFPAVSKGAPGKKHLEDFSDPNEVASAQKLVDKWRAALQGEAQGDSSGQGIGSAQSISQQLLDFRSGLQSGKEVMLEENPFYELTCLFYRINLAALKNAFVSAQKDASSNPPRPIKVSRSYRHIWASDSSTTSLKQKLTESLAKVGSLGKLAIGLILFAGSTMTTAKGVIDLVQLPGFVDTFGDAMVGGANEGVRTTFALIVGLVLSSVILDFKSRLFQGAAEVGSVFRGFYHAFRRHPRWVFASLFLTMISVWTNYDGIVLLMSKTEDLAYQWAKIEKQVNSALGDETQLNVVNPASLRDLHATLPLRAREAIKKFQQVPEDERSGAASSGIAKIGPRYWAKHFIVYGGYVRGRNTIATSYKNTSFVRRIDTMLVRSGLDLSLSLEEKINRILATYEARYRETETAVQAGMGALSDTMTFKDYSLDELLAMFNLESYHVNEGVQRVVGQLEQNKEAFALATQAINKLAEAHIALLQAVDKVGTPANNEYTIEVNIGIPRVDAIDQLRQGEIPMAKRRNLVELKALMMERYGVAVGTMLLSLILFLAVFMDLSDPILYSAMIARWGRRDRHFLDENVVRFQRWEDIHVQELRKFFVQPEVLAMLPKLATPKIQSFHHLYNHFLEDVEPRVKDVSNRGWFESFRFWFLGLFLETRLDYVEGYNARQTALLKCLKHPEVYAPRLLNRVFPGLLDPFRVGVDHFDALFDKTFQGMKRDSAEFEHALLMYAPDADETLPQSTTQSEDAEAAGFDPKQTLEGRLVRLRASAPFQRWLMIHGWLYVLLFKPLSTAGPAFPLTRISRLQGLALSNYKSRGHINYLAEFVPSFRHFLRERLFVIKREMLQPLSDALSRIPNGAVIEYSLRINELREEYARMERGLMELLGLSQFQGIQVGEQMVRTIIEQSEIKELIDIYLRRNAEEAVLEKRIKKMESDLSRAHKLIKDLVEGQDTLIYTLTKIRREHMSPINATLSTLQTRDKVEAFLGLHKMKEDLSVIEKCLLELWDTSSGPFDVMNVDSIQSSTEMGAVIDLIRRNAEGGKAFDMIDYVHQLEVKVAGAHKKLDSTIYSLAMVDKITANVLGLLDHALELVEHVLTKDAELQEFPVIGQEVDQKKLDFLADNRLFFRTVSLQVDSLRARINSLGGEEEDSAVYSVELARDVEKQAIMLRYFLKNTLDYLEGKRDSIGLTAALAELRPRKPPPPPPPPPPVAEKTADASDGDEDEDEETPEEEEEDREEEKTEEVVVDEKETPEEKLPPPHTMKEEIQETCARVKQILLDLSLLEWDLLKKPIPPQNILREIHAQQPTADKVGVEVEGVLIALEGLSKDKKRRGKLNVAPDNRPELQKLQDQAANLLEQLGQIFSRVSVSASVDRRLTHRSMKTPEAQRHLVDRVRKAEAVSRRGTERTVLQSQVELTLPDGKKIFATTCDIGARAMCLRAPVVLDGVVAGMSVTFRMLSDDKKTVFPGKLLRVRGSVLIVSLLPGHEGQFIGIVRAEVLRERGGNTPAGAQTPTSSESAPTPAGGTPTPS